MNLIDTSGLAQKNIVVSGGTTGIGRATAIMLSQLGADVFVFGRHKTELNDAFADAQKASAPIEGALADQSEQGQVQAVFEQARETLGGPIDILINNAGLGAAGMLEDSFEQWEYVMRTNLFGYVACTEQVIPDMQAKGTGHILSIGSMSALEREAKSTIYVATKAAIQGWSESLRKELNPKGIRVTLIEPGLTGTDMSETPPGEQEKLQAQNKMLMAEDIARMVVFSLCQPERCDIVELRVRPHQQLI